MGRWYVAFAFASLHGLTCCSSWYFGRVSGLDLMSWIHCQKRERTASTFVEPDVVRPIDTENVQKSKMSEAIRWRKGLS